MKKKKCKKERKARESIGGKRKELNESGKNDFELSQIFVNETRFQVILRMNEMIFDSERGGGERLILSEY
jgi:hypothetical protein